LSWHPQPKRRRSFADDAPPIPHTGQECRKSFFRVTKAAKFHSCCLIGLQPPGPPTVTGDAAGMLTVPDPPAMWVRRVRPHAESVHLRTLWPHRSTLDIDRTHRMDGAAAGPWDDGP
jgi:hypothetical protein